MRPSFLESPLFLSFEALAFVDVSHGLVIVQYQLDLLYNDLGDTLHASLVLVPFAAFVPPLELVTAFDKADFVDDPSSELHQAHQAEERPQCLSESPLQA